jgi:transcriptional regulator with PAS, ATPase and Fis domain
MSKTVSRKFSDKTEVISPGLVSGLFESTVVLSSILDGLPLGVLVLDPERRVVLMNRGAEALTGLGRENAWRVPCRYVLRASLCSQDCPALKSLAAGSTAVVEGDLINRERSKIFVRLTCSVLRDAGGGLLGFLETVEDIRHVKRLDDGLRPALGFGQILGRSPKMEELFRILPVVAQTDSTVLIAGETGTGKDLVAEALHEASGRKRGPFIKVSCGALPEMLLESEMFGHQKGAFAGALGDKPGRIRLAHKGTLFFTEIGDLSLSLQVKLLSFLDDKVAYPLGGARGFQSDVRVVAATNRNLEQMVREGSFREDLMFRLNVVRLKLPPLRDRGQDVLLLADHFLKLFSARFEKKIAGLAAQVRSLLAGYSFPGNVRELRNIIEYATTICQEEEIGLVHLPGYLTGTGLESLPEAGLSVNASDLPAETETSGAKPEDSWQSLERQMILDALVKAKGRRSVAADILGWGRSTLWRKMKVYGL